MSEFHRFGFDVCKMLDKIIQVQEKQQEIIKHLQGDKSWWYDDKNMAIDLLITEGKDIFENGA